MWKQEYPYTYSNAWWARISLVEVRILIRITEGKDVAGMHLSGNFICQGRFGVDLLSVPKTLLQDRNILTFTPTHAFLPWSLNWHYPRRISSWLAVNHHPREGIGACLSVKRKLLRNSCPREKACMINFKFKVPCYFCVVSGRKAQGMESHQPDWHCEPVHSDRSREHRHRSLSCPQWGLPSAASLHVSPPHEQIPFIFQNIS